MAVNTQQTKEEASWERERDTNVKAYALMKADILALREEVASFYTDREKIAIKKRQPGSTGNPTLTVVDLKEHLPRLGLGPESLDLLELEKEDIGLKNPVTILDYPSPPERYRSIQLSDQEIRKCREQCDFFFWELGKEKNKEVTDKHDNCEDKNETLEYLVEFPNEE